MTEPEKESHLEKAAAHANKAADLADKASGEAKEAVDQVRQAVDSQPAIRSRETNEPNVGGGAKSDPEPIDPPEGTGSGSGDVGSGGSWPDVQAIDPPENTGGVPGGPSVIRPDY